MKCTGKAGPAGHRRLLAALLVLVTGILVAVNGRKSAEGEAAGAGDGCNGRAAGYPWGTW